MTNYSGEIYPIETISGQLGVALDIGGELSNQMAIVTGEMIVPRSANYEVYTGDYEVDPRFTSQTLETQSKLMADNVTINEIAVSTVQNPQGGNTVWIGVI